MPSTRRDSKAKPPRADGMLALVWGVHVALILSAACSGGNDTAGPDGHGASTAEPAASRSATSSASPFDDPDSLPGEELVVNIPEGERAFVSLASVEVVDGGAESLDWDLAFEGWDVFTNGGPSGAGDGAGFGPNEELDFLFETAPSVPFMRPDRAGGAFLDWYAYDGETHQLSSRTHTYGVRDGDRLWKVQLLSYYGEQLGAPVSALYRLRTAEVTEDGASETQDITGLDATAGYPKVDDSKPSGCLSLVDNKPIALTPDEASDSKKWQLCFRRDQVSVNGESGGPGDVSAVDLDAERTEDEALETLQALTDEATQAEFDAVDYKALTKPELAYRGDRVVSIFSDAWLVRDGDDVAPAHVSWLVTGADGVKQYSVVFRSVKVTSSGVTKVTLRVREVQAI